MRLMRTLNNLFFTLGLAASIEATPYAYVTDPNDNIVVPINLATKTVGTPITGFNSPFYSVITSDGLTAYVGSEGTSVQSIAIPSNVVTNISGTFNGAQCLAITPDNSTVYFVNNFTSDTDLVTPVSVATNQGQTPLNLPGYQSPSAIAVNPLGNMAYIVVSDALNARSLVNMAIPSNTFGAFVTGFTDPNWITFTPDGTLAYVTDDDDKAVYIVDVASNTITGTVTGTFSNPRFIAIYGSTGYVIDDNGLTPVNLTTNTAGTTIPISLAIYMAITSDGTTGYLSSLFSGVYILDLTSNPPTISEITSPDLNFPWAIALSEAQIFPSPSNLQGKKLSNQFLLQLDLINQITWSPPIGGPVPYAYKIYRDNLSSLIATVYSGTPLVFQDHKRQKGVPTTYYIVGLMQGGTTTSAASITF